MRIVRSLAAAAIFASFVASAGCADSESMIFIKQAQVPTPGRAGGGCTVDSSPTSLARLGGTLDVAFSVQYAANLLIGNQLLARGSRTQIRTETAGIQLEGAEVRLEDASGAVFPGYPISIPGTGYVPPSTGGEPEYGIFSTLLIESVAGKKLQADLQSAGRGRIRRLTSHIVAFGHTLGGQAVQSGEWQFPIEVCFGCLVSFPSDAIVNVGGLPTCQIGGAAGTSTPTAGCDFGQDDPVDCRFCKVSLGDNAICNP